MCVKHRNDFERTRLFRYVFERRVKTETKTISHAIKIRLMSAGDQLDEIRQNEIVDVNRSGRPSDEQIAIGGVGARLVFHGRSHVRALRVQSISTVPKVHDRRADGRFAETGTDDQPHHDERR